MAAHLQFFGVALDSVGRGIVVTERSYRYAPQNTPTVDGRIAKNFPWPRRRRYFQSPGSESAAHCPKRIRIANPGVRPSHLTVGFYRALSRLVSRLLPAIGGGPTLPFPLDPQREVRSTMASRELERIRRAVLDQRYTLTEHAYDEMDDDQLDVLDVEAAILTGRVEQTMTKDPRGTRYVVVGMATDEATMVGVVARFVERDELLVLTVYEIK